jgi:HPt (histidine-containing phosphotransfer) domain-containing protein
VDPGTLYGALDKWLPGGLAPDQRDPGVPAGVRHVPGAHGSDAIDMEAGLAAIGGNQRLYQSLLSRFAVHYGSGLFQLREMLERGDFPGASRLAHTIKGVAANLGMRRVTELTKTMETSLPEVPPDESLLAEYETAMREALDCIAGLGISVRRIAVGTRELSEGCRRELLAFLGTLARRVETDWGTVQRELESYMATVDQTPYAEQMEQLMASVNDFDIIGIGRHLAPLCRHLEAAA